MNKQEVISEDIYRIQSNQQQLKEKLSNTEDRYISGLFYGVLAAIGMTLFSKLFNGLTEGSGIAIIFLKYLVMGVVLAWALFQQKVIMEQRYHFFAGVCLGTFISVITGFALAIINLLLSTTFPDLAFTQFTETGDTTASVLVISGVLFFESLVLGMILTMIILQYLKRKRAGLS